jgi:hypothetical protein
VSGAKKKGKKRVNGGQEIILGAHKQFYKSQQSLCESAKSPIVFVGNEFP